MKAVKRLFKNKKGIDTILAALLMVVIVVVASVMVYAWSTGLLGGLLVTPQTGKEALNLENTGWSSTNSTSATLYIRNSGSASINLVTYYVKDSAGDQYSRTTWTGPTIPVNGLGTTPINIGLSCSNCQLTGNAFSYTAGNSYTVVVVTSRNNQFTFTVVR